MNSLNSLELLYKILGLSKGEKGVLVKYHPPLNRLPEEIVFKPVPY